MTIATPQPMTLEAYLSYDDGTDTCHELVDGVLVEMGSERRLNEKIALWLLSQFLQFVSIDLIARGTQLCVAPKADDRSQSRPYDFNSRIRPSNEQSFTIAHYPRHACSSPSD
ncbi:MAG: hypothetical protein HC769_33530 [Cyanobacteria bacterium CRU_2_1]|nr:hypothetical protein [Cyanobacteria bacterium RU_5_0]NJR63271.1 hypothetical protein [Cyanobacteria bacterium CRU_2_1]